MGNSNSAAQPTDYQVESSESVTLYDCSFLRLDPDIEHVFPHESGAFYKYSISFEFTLNQDPLLLKCILTRDLIYENVVIGQVFPLKHRSEVKAGLFEEMGVFEVGGGACHVYTVELFVPKNLAMRRVCGFILDEEDVVMAKARGIVAFEDEFRLSDLMESRVSLERASRTIRLDRLSMIRKQKSIQRSLAGLNEALKTLSQLVKSRVEFIEATDSTRLAYRGYHPREHTPTAILIIVAGNSHFHDIIASAIADSHAVDAYILELRGYGYSGGLRGMAPSKEQVWLDIKTFIRFTKMNAHRSIPIFLAGHYEQGGLILNYATWREREPVNGYAFISPYFGEFAQDTTNRAALQYYSDHVATPSRSGSLSSLAGTFFGAAQPDQRHLLSNLDREINPMIVDSAGPAISKACTAPSPLKQFSLVDRPFALWVGEKEEFLIADKLIKYPKRATVASSINVMPELTHMGVFNNVSMSLGDWMVTVDAGTKHHLNAEHLDGDELTSRSSLEDYQHPVLRDLDIVMKSYLELGLSAVKSSFLVANDGTQIRYQIFSCRKRPTANVVMLQTDVKVLLAWLLSNKCDVAVYCMDLRGIDNGGVCLQRDAVLNDVKLVVRHLKSNNPDLPLLIAGHGCGASVALNYSGWRNRETVNGYLFVSPLVDPRSTIDSDIRIVKRENMSSLFSSDSSAKSWMSSHSLIDSMITYVRPAPSLPILDNFLCRNVHNLISSLEVPFGLWLGSDDELIDSETLCRILKSSKLKAPLYDVQVVGEASHLGNLIVSSAYITPFLKRFMRIIAPSLSFKLRNPSLADFERIQLIGRGSFGRVYLIKHKVTNKFFAMKALSKKDVIEADEVQHVITERNILRDTNSSFVVSFVGSFQNEHSLYILMEYVIGGELFTQLSLQGGFSNDTALFYAAEVVLFFEEIHGMNIIYRDLKPENILIDAMGHIKITDLGFAKYMANKRTMTFCGTPQYMAPEVILNSQPRKKNSGYGVSVDYYSLGVLIYEMLVGQTPFHDTNIKGIYRKVLYGTIEYPWTMDAIAKDLIRSLLVRNPSRRLGSSPGHSVENIKRHKWFRGIDWEKLKRREIAAPFVPRFSHAGDTSNFVNFGRDRNSSADGECAADYGDQF
eukprot:Partr_v1_DN28540_c1_g1_i4_m73939 putative CAMP-dependent protein kinase, catalytic subunit